MAFDYNEAVILAYFNTDRADDCQQRCEVGLELLKDPQVRAHVTNPDGTLQESINCRNYLINVVVGMKKDYDSANAILDRFVDDGLISAEEAVYRKESIKTFRLQRTFEGIFSDKRTS